ncbi:hypothetical protein [Virgibacillus ainsalahensis]
MMEEQEKQKIADKLKQFPVIIDETDKDDLFQRISSHQDKDVKVNKNKRFIPALGIIMTFVIIVFIVPSLLNSSMFQNNDEQSADYALDVSDQNEVTENQQESTTDSFGQESSNDDVEQETMLADPSSDTHVIQEIGDNMTIVHGAISDSKQQYVIPLSLIVSESDDISTHYNNLDDRIEENEWGVSNYPFEDVSFTLRKAENLVVMDLPKNHTLGEGSAKTYIFEQMLTRMFTPHGIEKVIFDTKDNQRVNLGKIGVVQELPIREEKEESYKLYRKSEETRSFLIPISNEEQATIEDALNELKIGQKSLNVYQTIPDDVNFSVKSGNRQLIVSFAEDSLMKSNQDYVTMIEAILMTAKSYGYETVNFKNSSIEQIGAYDLSVPVEVPDAVNPI